MIYWKIVFTDGIVGDGWVRFDDSMQCTGLFDDTGNEVYGSVGYHPVETESHVLITTDTQPWG